MINCLLVWWPSSWPRGPAFRTRWDNSLIYTVTFSDKLFTSVVVMETSIQDKVRNVPWYVCTVIFSDKQLNWCGSPPPGQEGQHSGQGEESSLIFTVIFSDKQLYWCGCPPPGQGGQQSIQGEDNSLMYFSNIQWSSGQGEETFLIYTVKVSNYLIILNCLSFTKVYVVNTIYFTHCLLNCCSWVKLSAFIQLYGAKYRTQKQFSQKSLFEKFVTCIKVVFT